MTAGEGCSTSRESNEKSESIDTATNHSIKHFQCDSCHEKFSQAGSLRSHQRKHTGSCPFPCTAVGCMGSFRTQSDRARHVRIHTGVKSHHCDRCPRLFSTKANLHTHQTVVHEKLKPYICRTCQRGFGYLTNYRNHLRTHTNERPYVCSHLGCDRTFSEYSSALQHALLVHANHGSFKCEQCDKVYRSRSGLNHHVKATHTPREQNINCPAVTADDSPADSGVLKV